MNRSLMEKIKEVRKMKKICCTKERDPERLKNWVLKLRVVNVLNILNIFYFYHNVLYAIQMVC